MDELNRLLESCNFTMKYIPLPLVVTDKNGSVLFWSRQAEKAFGHRSEDIVGQPIPIQWDEYSGTLKITWEKVLHSVDPIRFNQTSIPLKDGTVKQFDLILKSFTIENERCVIILLESAEKTGTPVSSNDELSSLTKGLEQQFMMVYLDLDGLITYANDSFLQLSKWTPKRIVGKSFWQLFPEDEGSRDTADKIWNVLRSGKTWNGIIEKAKRKSGTYWAELTAIPIRSSSGESLYYILLEQDITEKMTLQQNLEEIAFVDPITGLMNSHHLEKIVDEMIDEQRHFSFVYLSIDQFYTLKDLKEEDLEKELLVEFKKRLKMFFQDSVIAKVNVNEFVIITPLGDWFVQGFLSFLKQHPIYLDNVALPITVSGSISKFPDDQNSFIHLMKASHSIVRQVQSNGGGAIASLSKSSHESLNRKIMIEKQLMKALDRKDLQVVYQPQVDLNTNRIVSVEAFVRWQDEVLGVVSPEELIPVAEESGLIQDIGAFMLEQSCQQAAAWAKLGYDLKVSINSSVREFRNPNMVKTVMETLDKSKCKANKLKIEITEKFALEAEAEQSITKQMNQLKKLGIEFVLDDFGTGYASFRYMQLLPITEVKIDQTYIQSLTGQVKVKQLVDGMIQFGKSMNMRMLAEGVETEEQYDMLKGMGCDVIQGYLISKPMLAEELEKLLITHNK
ncbi:EAL domain-containing protein [Chungangia koreensis]|uniref:EAL domain-containing protein n=1 Tax=Chungangia koreensis TaxID=752657 RepID=A0ABV8X4C1_9LACT